MLVEIAGRRKYLINTDYIEVVYIDKGMNEDGSETYTVEIELRSGTLLHISAKNKDEAEFKLDYLKFQENKLYDK